MKTLYIKIGTICLLVILIASGCKKNVAPSSLWEITAQSDRVFIQNEMNGIEFKFFLLNKEGQPATIFNQGDNFTFSFSFKNNLQDPIIVTSEFINPDFLRVYLSQNNIDLGRPWTGSWCEFSGLPSEFKLNPSSDIQLTCPWLLSDNEKPVYPLCMGKSKDPLTKGDYYTIIDLDFHYSNSGKETIINNVKLKINFKIE